MYPFFNERINNNKPILLIGNSPNIKDYELGEYINENNFNIIRFNFSTTQNFEKYIGKDTTFRIINGVAWNTQRDKIPKDNILIAEPSFTKHYKILSKYPTNIMFKSIYIIPIYSKKYIDSWATSGMIAISFFLQFYKYIYIYGFSFNHNHYFDINKSENKTHHDYNKEKIVVDKLINENRIIYLNSSNCKNIKKIEYIENSIFYNNFKNQNNNLKINIINIKNSINNNYFLFNDINIINEGDTQYCRVFSIKKNKFINVVLWGYLNGDGDIKINNKSLYHGKCFDNNINFELNDELIIYKYYSKIKVLCNKHKFGDKVKGMYFHFDDKIQEENQKEIQKVYLKYCYIPKLNIKKKIIIWNINKGGDYGNSHGRYFKFKNKYDFYIGDIIVILT